MASEVDLGVGDLVTKDDIKLEQAAAAKANANPSGS
jgi:hypothetical protein